MLRKAYPIIVPSSLCVSLFWQIDKFLYSSEDYIKAGAVLAVGIVSRYVLVRPYR